MSKIHYKYPLARPYIDNADKKAVLRVLESGYLSGGSKYLEFEKKMANYLGVKYACSVSSGTAGLHLAVKALEIGRGDEVITTPFSFVASSNCLLYERAKPVFVDIEDVTYNINPQKIEAAIGKKTKAILPVHIFGQSCEMDKIVQIAKKYGLHIIEDACESLGSKYMGKKTGTFGEIGVFAFYPNKQMTTGEGGMIATNSKTIYEICSSLRNQGRSINDQWLRHERLGYNYRMNEMSAALGISQLKKLDWMIKKRQQIVAWYNSELADTEGIIVPKIGSFRTHTWFLYVIRLTKTLRNDIIRNLAKAGIASKNYMPTIHLQPFMRKLFGYRVGDFPISEMVASQSLALPFYIQMNKSDVKKICNEIKKIV